MKRGANCAYVSVYHGDRTRVPVFLPQRVTDELVGVLTKYAPL